MEVMETASVMKVASKGFKAVFLLAACLMASTACGQEEAEEEGENLIRPMFEELFLGTIVYAQEEGALQVTSGFFWNQRREDYHRVPLILEYGITERFQIEAELPIDFERGGPGNAEGLGNVELGAYYNFYNNPCQGRAFGVGFELGLPSATNGVGKDALIYEPFFVAYQEFQPFAVNFSAGLEIEDPTVTGEETEVAGELAIAAFRRVGQFVPILELGMEIETEETDMRLAPGIYWKPPRHKGVEIGVSLPIGLTKSAPDIGAFLQINLEFEREKEESEAGED